jgi:separase
VSSGSGKASPTKDENHSSAGSTAILQHARAFTNGLEWQIAEGMLETTLSLANVYLRRGSVREAEYFIREAEQLAGSINAPALLGQALAMKVQVQLQLRQLETALTTLHAATNTLNDLTGPDAAGLRKLQGEHSELLLQNKDAQQQYTEALKMLEELDKMFLGLEAHKRHCIPYLCKAELTPFSRRSSVSLSSPLRSKDSLEPPAPALFSAVLQQHSELSRHITVTA